MSGQMDEVWVSEQTPVLTYAVEWLHRLGQRAPFFLDIRKAAS